MIGLLLALASLLPVQEGTKIWEYETGGSINSSPTVSGGRVYVGSSDGKLYCFDAASGERLWEAKTGAGIRSSALVTGGRVIIGSADKKLHCFDAATGKRKWEAETGGQVMSLPAIRGNRLYVTDSGGNVVCLNADTGASIWDVQTGGPIYSSPYVTKNRVTFGTRNNSVLCLDASSGKTVWEFSTGGAVFSHVTVAGNRAYFGCYDRKVYCVDAESGEGVWEFETGGASYLSPSVVDGKVYVGSGDMRMYCLDAKTGEKDWDFVAGGQIWGPPAVVGGKVYFGSYDHKLYCLRAATGEKLWDFTAGGRFFSSPAVMNGKVYIGSNDRKLYCIDAGDPSAHGWPMLLGRRADWPLRTGTTWRYRAERGVGEPITVTLTGFSTLDGAWCASFKWSTGLKEALSIEFDGVHIRRSSRVPTLDKCELEKIKALMKQLRSESFDERETATQELAQRWYAARDLIVKEARRYEAPELLSRIREIRHLARSRHAPLAVPMPLRTGLTWTNIYGDRGEVLALESIETGLGKRPAWKLKMSDRTLWWSEEDSMPVAFQIGETRWVLHAEEGP